MSLQFEMAPRVSPLNDARNHVIAKTDKTYMLYVQYINALKGKVLHVGISQLIIANIYNIYRMTI